MNDEIKEILDKAKEISKYGADGKQHTRFFNQFEAKLLLDYITNLQEQLHQASLDIQELIERDIWCPTNCDKLTNLQQENERLKGIAHKMHLWIFLNSGNEQKVYDELGLTDEENTMLGYSGQIRIGGGDNE